MLYKQQSVYFKRSVYYASPWSGVLFFKLFLKGVNTIAIKHEGIEQGLQLSTSITKLDYKEFGAPLITH